MNAECDCQPQVSVQFHTVPFGHQDDYALDVITGLLNGQSGRLNKSLVLDRKIAASASATQQSWKYNGFFALSAETQGDASPADLEAALWAEVERLQNEPVPADELQKVKNSVLADSFRRLQSPFFLLVQILFYEGWGDSAYLNTSAERTLAVTAEDVQRVAKRYFTRAGRTVATYARKVGSVAEAVPPELAGLPEPMKNGVLAQLKQIRAIEDPGELEQVLGMVEQQKAAVPPEMKPVVDLVERTARERLEELKAGAAKKEESK